MIVLFLTLLLTFKAHACPITIFNDTDQQIIVIDPRGSESLYLEPNASAIIDPTVSNPVMRYFLNEKLEFYFPVKAHPNTFYKKYRLREKFCDDAPTELTLSQIINFAQNPPSPNPELTAPATTLSYLLPINFPNNYYIIH